MTVIKNPENWELDDCVEDCHYVSRFCHEKEDGIIVCPSGIRECADDCRERFSS